MTVKHTILAVDDIPSNLVILTEILKDTYKVVEAESGAEALELLSRIQPDLLLLDLSMPDMDGFELLKRIREYKNCETIPVIFVTANDDAYSEEKGLRLGAVDYLRKPYVANMIRAKVRNHIELKIYRDDLEATVAARTKELEERAQQLYESHSATIMGMSLVSESHDKITGAHLLRLKNLTGILARHFAKKHPDILSMKTADTITMYSPLHDIGKAGVSDAILKKQGKLTNEEFDQMKGHTTGGANLLRDLAKISPSESGHMKIAIEIAECHHERFDGTGYPNRLQGDEIPISARIVSIADIYDALRSSRPYKEGFTHEEAMNIILTGDGRTVPSHFDPLVLQAFSETHEELRDAYDANPDPHIAEML
ncbi:MAG: response regulator [Defluviitaleaceae bacterium]|nr:response regulator [Defluviitaleaceae bacterium]